jgi:hypothetical protein
MTMLALYPSKKDLKAAVGHRLRYEETSAFGAEYKDNGTVTVAGRPHLSSIVKREFFARVTLKDGIITKVE